MNITQVLVSKIEQYDEPIRKCVDSLIDKTGGVYTDDIKRTTGAQTRTITDWLKANGFHKPGGCTSRRWVK